ncbi:MAG: alpha/beta hydrolase family esterase, partial [Aquihabitans sp.]
LRRPAPLVGLLIALLIAVLAAGCSSSGSDPRPAAPSTTRATGTTRATSTTATSTTTAAPPVGGPSTVVPAVDPLGEVMPGSLVTADGRTRTYRVYVPTEVAQHPDRPVPLLIALHGGLGWGAQFERTSGFDGLAEANGFVVVYPDGFDAAPGDRLLQTWNAGACCGPAVRLDVPDVGFVRELIALLEEQYPIAPGEVVAAGHSNGGMLALRLGCELADEIAAVGVQSSPLEVATCEPARPVSLLQIHGTADDNVPIDGGVGTDAVSGVDFEPPIEAARTYAAADACPDPEQLAVEGNADLAVTSWAPCDEGAAVAFVQVEGGTHAWMGPSRGGGATGPPYEDLDASLVIWSFLSRHLRT